MAAFTVDGWKAHELGEHLATRGIAVRAGSFCAHPLVAHLLGVDPAHTLRLLHAIECGEDVLIPGAVRASIGLGTTEADIDALLDALGEVLPERRPDSSAGAAIAGIAGDRPRCLSRWWGTGGEARPPGQPIRRSSRCTASRSRRG